MSTIAIAVTVTYTGLTASTIPSPTGNRTMAATDKALTDKAEDLRRYFADQFQAVDPNADRNTTVAVTVT